MTQNEIDTLKRIAQQEFYQYGYGLDILSNDKKDFCKEFSTKGLRTQDITLTRTQRIMHTMGFIDALAWLNRDGKIVLSAFPVKRESFDVADETPEDRARYLEEKYKGLTSEERARAERYDQQCAEEWEAEIQNTIAENTVLRNLINYFVFGN